MEQPPGALNRRLWWLAAAIVAGAVIGWLDLSATEVQGPLLLIMVAAFVVGMVGFVPPWAAGAAVALAMSGIHLVAWAVGAGNASGFGSIIAIVPSIAAAYGGRLMGTLVERAAESLPYGRAGAVEIAEAGLPWYSRRDASRGLLAIILCGSALIGAPVTYHALLVAGQPITWWVTIIWQILTLMGWIILTPLVIAQREGKPEELTADVVATAAAQMVGLAMVHSIALVLLTSLLLIPPGTEEIFLRIARAFTAYLPLDIVTFVLLWTLAYVSNADRHLREAAVQASARAASLSAELNASRLTALRAQLQPHFLFNAINAAVVLSSKGDANGAAAVLNSLAGLLRYVLADGSETVRLGDELGFVERYLAVERARFPDRLRFAIEAAAEIRNALVPHLLLQPLVENAVRHGIAGKIAGGEIRVSASAVGDRLEIIVEDDGAGMQNTGTAPNQEVQSSGGHGLGLANTRARLSLIYGDKAELTLSARAQDGTICRVTIPLTFAGSS